MNLLDEIILNIQKKFLAVKFQRENDVYVCQTTAFAFIDLETSRYVQRGISHQRFLEYKSRGIALFQLTSDVTAIKLRNFIISKLKLQPKIPARKCIVKGCELSEYENILRKYHIQGTTKSHVKLGLYYNQSLVAALGANKTDGGWLLNRLVFSDVAVIGGASKLVSNFRKKYSGEIETFSNNAYSDGNVYEALGFSRGNETKSDLWYVDRFGKLLNRRRFQKQNLKDLLEHFDSQLTENQNMVNNGFGVYYGPGTVKWTLI